MGSCTVAALQRGIENPSPFCEKNRARTTVSDGTPGRGVCTVSLERPSVAPGGLLSPQVVRSQLSVSSMPGTPLAGGRSRETPQNLPLEGTQGPIPGLSGRVATEIGCTLAANRAEEAQLLESTPAASDRGASENAGAPSTTRTCDLLVRNVGGGVANRPVTRKLRDLRRLRDRPIAAFRAEVPPESPQLPGTQSDGLRTSARPTAISSGAKAIVYEARSIARECGYTPRPE